MTQPTPLNKRSRYRDFEPNINIRPKRPPIYMMHELAPMFGMTVEELRQMMAVASRKGEPYPQPVPHIKGNNGKYLRARLKYYNKQDFVDFLHNQKEKA